MLLTELPNVFSLAMKGVVRIADQPNWGHYQGSNFFYSNQVDSFLFLVHVFLSLHRYAILCQGTVY